MQECDGQLHAEGTCGVSGLDVGDDVATCELGPTGADLEPFDGVEDRVSAAGAAVGEGRAHR